MFSKSADIVRDIPVLQNLEENMSEIRVLICDDNIAVHESLTTYLKAERIDAVSVYDGESALEQMKRQHFDLIVLDVMLPRMFGTIVCQEIRKTSDVPILMLSAKGEELDRLTGLGLGADDYVTKPFSPREIVVRIKTILRRVSPLSRENRVIRVEELVINMESYEVFVASIKIDLTPRETEMLCYLVKNRGRVLTRDQCLNAVWGYDYDGDTRAVDTQIKRIRKKLPEAGVHFAIKGIYGVGYKFEVTK